MYRDGISDGPIVLSAFNGWVIGLRAIDGTEVWRVLLGHGSAGAAVRLHVTPERVVALGRGELVEIEYATGRVSQRVEVVGGTLLVVGRRAFVSQLGEVTCVDLDAGRVLWTNPLPKTGFGAAALGMPGHVAQSDPVQGDH